MNYSQRIKMKKPIFDEYYPTTFDKQQLKALTQSVSPISSKEEKLFSNSLQSTYTPMTYSKHKEKIFQYRKPAVTIAKAPLIDLKPKEHHYDFLDEIQVSEFNKPSLPLQFQSDKLIQRHIDQVEKKQELTSFDTKSVNYKNDKFIQIGIGVIVFLLIIVGILKYLGM